MHHVLLNKCNQTAQLPPKGKGYTKTFMFYANVSIGNIEILNNDRVVFTDYLC